MSTTPPLTNPLIENDYFYLSPDGTYYIVGVEGMTCTGEPAIQINGHLDIPAEYNGKPVKEIGDLTFNHCKSLTTITIPDSVTSIGNYAFYSSALTSINIPDSVTSIGMGAFVDCSLLTSINIPNSVTSIGHSAFLGCSLLTSINIPNSVTSIGNWTFQQCSALTSINIPDSVTSIGDLAFVGCSSLTSVIIKDKPVVASDVFRYTPKLEKIYVIDGKGYSPTDTLDGKPIEILPADGAVVAKTMTVKSMTIS